MYLGVRKNNKMGNKEMQTKLFHIQRNTRIEQLMSFDILVFIKSELHDTKKHPNVPIFYSIRLHMLKI